MPTETRVAARERVRELEPADGAARDEWIAWLLREALASGDRYRDGAGCDHRYAVPEYRTELHASGVLVERRWARVFSSFGFRSERHSTKKLRGDDWNTDRRVMPRRSDFACESQADRLGDTA